MKLKLAYKLGIIIVSTVILSAAVSSAIISVNTRSAFLKLVKKNDINAAQNIGHSLEEYYARYGNWEGIDRLLENPFALYQDNQDRGFQAEGMGRMGPMEGGMDSHMGSRFMRRNEMRPLFRILLSDEEGDVILHTFDDLHTTEKLSQRTLDEGVALWYRGERIGYVFVGSMIESAFGPFQRAFLSNVYRSILLAALIVGIIFPFIGVLLMQRHIIEPLKRLTRAANKVAAGDYKVRTDTRRVDEIGELSNSFQKMASELASTDEWKRKLIADSAHELRTPVSILQGNLEMMIEGVYECDKERIEGLYTETLLLNKLVQELQDLAHAESIHTYYTMETTDIMDILKSIVENFKTKALEKKIDLQLMVPNSSIQIVADRNKIKQVLFNVLQNSYRYAPEGGIVLAELTEHNANEVQISIEDNGEGIPVAEREKVFERFYRVQKDRNRSSGGTGLGLAIVREIVKRHGGKVYFEDPKALSGARIVILIPIK